MTKNGFTAIATPGAVPGTTRHLATLPGLQGEIYLAHELSRGSPVGESLLPCGAGGAVDCSHPLSRDPLARVASANGLAANAHIVRPRCHRDRSRRLFY